jgi:hypothetical protein
VLRKSHVWIAQLGARLAQLFEKIKITRLAIARLGRRPQNEARPALEEVPTSKSRCQELESVRASAHHGATQYKKPQVDDKVEHLLTSVAALLAVVMHAEPSKSLAGSQTRFMG